MKSKYFKPIEAHRMIFLGVAILLLMIFMAGFVNSGPSVSSSSLEYLEKDGVENKVVTITEDISHKQIAEIELISNLKQPEYVMRGKDRKVAEFVLDNYNKEHTSGLEKIQFYDIKTDKEINKDFTYKYKFRSYWISFNNLDELPSGKVTIGIFTDVYPKDYVEWIPTFFGARIDKWASWQEGWDVSLQSYYNLDSNSGAVIDSAGDDDGTTYGGVIRGEVGILGNAFNFSNGTDYVDVDADFDFETAGTVNFWVYNPKTEGIPINYGDSSTGIRLFNFEISSTVIKGGTSIGAWGYVNYPLDLVDKWAMVTLNFSTSDNIYSLFVNGTYVGTNTYTGDEPTSNLKLRMGNYIKELSVDFNGTIDEIGIWNRSLTATEISDLYFYYLNPDFNVLFQTFNSTTSETNMESFYINFTYNDTLYTDVYLSNLIYNGTKYTGDKVSNNFYSKTIDVGLIEGDSQDKEFYWEISLLNSSGVYYFNSSTNYQTISETKFYTDKCIVGTNLSLNFTAHNEDDLTFLSDFDFYGTFTYGIGSTGLRNNISISNSTVGNEILFCIYPYENTLYVDAQIQYEKEGYVKRTYYLLNSSITNVTNNIKLYLLNTTVSTSFIINVVDEVQFPVSDAYIYIQRYYPATGNFYTVEMAKTNSVGNTVGHFETETEDYKIIVIKDGVILYESESQKVFCGETPCTLNFQTEAGAPTVWEDIGELPNLVWSLDYNETTKMWSYSYVDTSGTTKYGRLLVYTKDGSKQNIICNNSDTSPAATLTCNVTGYDGIIFAEVYISRSPEILVWLESIIERTVKAVFGMEGLFWATLIILLIGLIGTWDPVIGIVMMLGGIILLNFLQIASLGSITIMGIVAIGGMLLWTMKKP